MSERKQGAAKRRDARATKTDAPARPVAAKKNTKRWCKGKVGREHKLECMKAPTLMLGDPPRDMHEHDRVLACTVCGKQLASYFAPRAWRILTKGGVMKPWPFEPKPDWVTF